MVESVDCGDHLHGFEQALASDAPVPLYTVAAHGIRLALVGPPGGAKASCEAIAVQMTLGGVPAASCVFPRSDPGPADKALSPRPN